MKRSELKNLIKECIIEEGSIKFRARDSLFVMFEDAKNMPLIKKKLKAIEVLGFYYDLQGQNNSMGGYWTDVSGDPIFSEPLMIIKGKTFYGDIDGNIEKVSPPTRSGEDALKIYVYDK